MQVKQDLLGELRTELNPDNIVTSLATLAARFPDKVSFSTSFGIEDQVIAHLIFENALPIRVFTLDTGRLFPETYAVWSKTLDRYGKSIETYFPNEQALQDFVTKKGPNSFYDSVDNRKSCCHIRKVEPLNRALAGQQIWITGIRADQSSNRQDMSDLEWDAERGLIKFHPIFNWNLEQVRQFIHKNGIPYNPLHDKGFVSIGCAPCTRAVRSDEDFRAGRWWWEDASKKECGLHVTESTVAAQSA